jgi:hypothetical protein
VTKFISKVSLTASGEVSDFTDEHKAGIGQKIADEIGASSDDITVTIESASVLISCEVEHDSKDAAEQATSQLKETLNSKESASAFLQDVPGLEDVEVTEEPVHAEVSSRVEELKEDEEAPTLGAAAQEVSADSEGLSGAGVAGIVIASILCVVAVVSATCFVRAYKMKQAKKGGNTYGSRGKIYEITSTKDKKEGPAEIEGISVSCH